MIGVHQEMYHPSSDTVFLVDDDAAIRKSVDILLKTAFLKSESYATASEFLENYKPDRTGCLLLDIRLPELNGLDFQEMLRRKGIFIPVIIVTAYADVAIAVRSIKLGAVDVIEKPFNDQTLLDRINEALRLDSVWRARRALQEQFFDCIAALTPREREVMDLIISGKSNKVIAFELGISRKTFELHRARAMEKMHVTNSVELARKAWVGKMTEPLQEGVPQVAAGVLVMKKKTALFH